MGRKATLKKAQEFYSSIKDNKFEKDFRTDTMEDIKYFTGEDQGWDEDGARAKLKAEGRPALTLSRITPVIRLMVGARPKTEARFIPVEDGDVETADTLNATKDHVEDINRWTFGEDDWFKGGVIMRRSVVELKPNYDKDVRGDVELKLHHNPFKFYLDPKSTEKDRSDMQEMIVEELSTPDEFKRMFPKAKEEIANLVDSVSSGQGEPGHDDNPADGYAGHARNDYYDRASKMLRVPYYWYKEHTKQTKIIDLAGQNEDGSPGVKIYDSPMTKEEAEVELEDMTDAGERFRVVSVNSARVKYMVFMYDTVLEEGANPWERPDGQRTLLAENFPYVIFEPERIIAGAVQELTSLIRPLHDAQKFHNKLASAVLEIVGTSANSGWEYEEGAISSKEEKKLRKFGSKPGVMVKWEKGALAESRARKIQPTGAPQGHMMEANQLAAELLDISGVDSLVNTKSLGKSASGRAIDLKQRQGGNIISWVYTSFRFFQQVLVEYVKDAVQMLYDHERVIRITGHKTRWVRINERVYDHEGAVKEILRNVSSGRYDVVLTDKEVLPSMRLERLKEFVDLAKNGVLQLPPEVMLKVVTELMDDPDLKAIIREDMGTDEQEKAQAQAQQIEMQDKMADIEQKKASIAKDLATAEKIKAQIKIDLGELLLKAKESEGKLQNEVMAIAADVQNTAMKEDGQDRRSSEQNAMNFVQNWMPGPATQNQAA